MTLSTGALQELQTSKEFFLFFSLLQFSRQIQIFFFFIAISKQTQKIASEQRFSLLFIW